MSIIVGMTGYGGVSHYFYWVGFLSIGVMLLFSAMISASEVAFFSIKGDVLEHCRQAKDIKNRNIVMLLSKPRRLLATILILNNFVNMGIVTASTFLMWQLVATREPDNIIIGAVTVVITFFITFFGEILPKVYATKYNLQYARLMSGAWKVMQRICMPLSWILLNMGFFVEHRFKKKGYSSTVKEINQALDLAADNDNAPQEEKDILKGIVNFGTLTVKQIMKSRVDITCLEHELEFRDLIEKVERSGFSRIPVYKGSLDKIEGVLYTKDLLPHLKESDGFAWQRLIRPSFFVPETKKLDSLFKDFQHKKIHMAVVVDEYGGTSGLVTLEDLIEEIIGEINDEFDENDESFVKINDNTFVFEGKTLLHDFCKSVDVDPSLFETVKGESESLAGLMLELSHSMPKVADQIVYKHFVFTIVSMDVRRIGHIRVLINDYKK